MKYARVHRWMVKDGKTSAVIYHFGKDIPFHIFEDDTVERVASKIAVGIHHFHVSKGETDLAPSLKAKPYMWAPKQGSLRFDVKVGDALLKMGAPWDRVAHQADMRFVYKEQALIEDAVQDIHILFASDASTAGMEEEMRVYFPDAASTWKAPSFDSLVAEDKLALQAWQLGEDLHASIQRVIVTKATFETQVSEMPDLPDLFHRISPSKKIPFMQLVEDEHKVMYKLHKKHSIRVDQLEHWTSWEHIPKVASLVVMMATNIQGIFCRIVIDHKGGVHVSYYMESKENIQVQNVLEHKRVVEEWLSKYFSKVKLRVTRTSVKVEVPAQNISLPTLSKHLSKYVSLFHVHRIQDNAIEASCKRSKNYQQKLDIADYIASRIHVGTPVPEIMSDLIDLGLSRDDVAFWLAQYQSNVETDAPRKKTLSSTGCVLRISKFATGFRVYIEQAASFTEVDRIYQWIYGSIMVLKKNGVPSRPVVAEREERAERAEREGAEERRVRAERVAAEERAERERVAAEERNSILNDDSFELSGGALGKTYQRYFSTELKKADPTIFKDANKYSRQCGATSLRQPVVISVKEKDNLDKSSYASSYDDAVLYGSDENHKNYYMCPRIWCPLSRVPLTEDQLKENDGKCPGPHFEEPIVLYQDKYWGKSSQKPHYVGFMDNRSPKGFCLPCCFTSKMKPNTAKQCGIPSEQPSATPQGSESARNEDVRRSEGTRRASEGTAAADENYIMGAPPPIDTNRFGSLPKSVHNVFMPTIAYTTCSKTISTTPCYVRHGVGLSDDSFMQSIAMALGLPDKPALLKYIQSKLDPVTFISLENGHVLNAFADTQAIDPHAKESKELWNEWKRWISKHGAYAKIVGIDIHNLKAMDSYVLSRELGIYKAYRNFMQHLRTTEPKNPQHLVDFFLRQGVLFTLWKRQGNQATMLCPYFRDVAAVLKAQQGVDHALMLLQDGNYFEPIEFKKRSAKGIALHPLQNIPSVVDLQSSCPPPVFDDKSMDILQKLEFLVSWTSLSLQNPDQFRFRSVILRSDMTLYGILTNSNALILLPRGCPIAILPNLTKQLGVSKVLHQEDIVGKVFSISNILTTDIQQYIARLQQIGFGFHFGTVLSGESSYILDAKLTISPVASTVLPVIRTVGNDDAMHISWKEQERMSTKWKQWQLLVGKIFITYYDTLVQPLLSKSREKQIETLLNTFPDITIKQANRVKLQQVLEEMPYVDGKEALERWIRSIQYHSRFFPYTNATVQYGSKDIIFSQAAIDAGIPWEKFMPSRTSVAKDAMNPSQSLMSTPVGQQSGVRSERRSAKVPCMIQKDKVQASSLPTKFKGYSFAKYKVWRGCNDGAGAEGGVIQEFVKWLMSEKEKGSDALISLDDIQYMKTITVAKLLRDEETAKVLSEDPSYLLAWGQVMKKKYKKPTELWSRSLQDLSYENRRAIWVENVATNSLLKWNDVDWYILSQLLGMNVFMIHRAKHGGTEQVGEKYARGNIADLFLSSYFLTGGDQWRNMPCIFLYKEYADTQCDYHVVVNEQNEVIHPITKKLPKDILELMEMHVSKRARD